MDNLRNKKSMVENATIDLCAGLFQKFVVSRDEHDLNMFLEASNRLPLEKRKEVIREAANHIRSLKLAEPVDEQEKLR